MSKYLFNKKIDPQCSYCEYGLITTDKKSILCSKKGVMLPYDSCKKFSYDPIQRIPNKPIRIKSHENEDFSL